MTFEKILEVFADYLSEDDDSEIVNTRRGYVVMYWDSCHNTWVTARLAETPDDLLDILLTRYEDYQCYKFTCENKRDPNAEERKEIERMGEALADRC